MLSPIRYLTIVAALVALGGCSTVPMEEARDSFYAGQPERAAEKLVDVDVPQRDQALFYMERGAMWQAAGEFENSSTDLIRAADTIEKFETLSVTHGAGSMVINDSMNRYVGFPFEQVLLHNLTAINHLSSGRADEAGVEARRALEALARQEQAGEPGIAFGWYMAALGLELADDPANAVNAYQRARELTAIPEPVGAGKELVYVALVGRGPRSPAAAVRSWSQPTPEVVVLSGQKVLGHAATLADTHDLMFRAAQAQAARKAVKTVGRVVMKEVIAESVESASDSEALGDLVRIILIGILERPDDRHWDTLPQWLMVARVPFSAAPESVVLRVNGRSIAPLSPPVRYGNTWFCFSRVLY